MATPHSLPSNPQRIAAQLPFSPSSPTSASFRDAAQRRNGLNGPHGGSVTSIPSHARSGSAVSSRSRPPRQYLGSIAEPPLPSSTLPPFQPRPVAANSTYASGILPSASFFYASRPNNNPPSPPPQLPRPSSPSSIVSSEMHAMVPVHLAPFPEHEVPGSDVSDCAGISTEDLHQSTITSAPRTTTMKHSREPLLPMGGRPRNSTNLSRQSPQLTSSPYGRSDSNVSTGGRMRDSFEKLFKRGLSFDVNRKSLTAGPSNTLGAASRSGQTSPVSPPHGRMTFEMAITDDGHYPGSPTSRYKSSSTPPHASSTSLQHMSFIPMPPTNLDAPFAETPILDAKSGKPMRRYRLHPSRNHFFLGGHILTGGDTPWAFLASLTVVLGITGVWFGTTCVWWWHNESPAVAAVGAYMCLLTISSMFATAFRDPGILPRDLDPEPPTSMNSADSLRAPLPRDLKVRAGIVRVKYCPTCRTYRPPRSSHCKMCDNCVDGCDHHCQWVNNCIGRRNYTSFFTFLLSAVLTLALVICTTAIHLWLLTTRRFGLSFKQALNTTEGIGSAVAFSISILVAWPVIALWAYHLRLLLLNVTTIEQIRNQAHKTLVPGPPPPNPFSHGNWRRNLLYVLCRPAGYSWLHPTGVATEDKREINPGLLQDGWQGQVAVAMEEGRMSGKGQ